MSEVRISRRRFIRNASFGLGALSLSSTLGIGLARSRPRAPNILLVVTDQLSLRAMGAYGAEWVRTPNMDDIAARGVRFHRSYCTSPVCSPSRSSMLTGLMPHETGVAYNSTPVLADVPNLGQVLRESNYDTVWTGKWHLGSSYPDSDAIPGFRYLRAARMNDLGTSTDPAVADEAISFLSSKHERPFFLAVSFHNPHDIGYWVRGYEEIVGEVDMQNLPPLPANFEKDSGEPEFIRMCRERPYYDEANMRTANWDERQWRVYLSAYYRLVERVDEQIGRVLAALDEAGLRDDTLIAFTSDHGEGMAAHHWVAKLMFYEECVTVPFVMAWRGVIPEGVSDTRHLVSGLDLMPTLCDYAGAEPPRTHGTSLRGVIENPDSPGRDFVVSELYPDPEDFDMQARMLRSRDRKYIAFSRGDMREMLFHLESDPGEMTNLAGDPQAREELERHREILRDWIARTEDVTFEPPR